MAFLQSRIDFERAAAIPHNKRDFRLDRMRDLLARLGNPQQRLRIIHVAGTKGKGSTSAMIASVLSAAGYRCGLYTSPHLDRLEERLMVDGQPCPESEFVGLIQRIQPIVEQMDAEGQKQDPDWFGPTYFEITTAMAFLYFATCSVERPVSTDVAVVEVGLGGRLDSTNVCEPIISVITSISYDHTDLLGSSLAEIAWEKAGIIKSGVPVVSGVVAEEPRRVITAAANQRGCRLLQLDVDFKYDYRPSHELGRPGPMTYASMGYQNSAASQWQNMPDIKLALLGRHQAANAAVAISVLNELEHLGLHVTEAAVRDGLANLNWPARVEVVARQPTVVIDAAHNVASIQSLTDTLQESFPPSRRLLVFGTTLGKDVRGMLQVLLPHFEAVILTRYVNNPRAVDVAELDKLAAELSTRPRYTCNNPLAAWQRACELATPADLVCITGSFFLAAEMRVEIARSCNSS
jgi:dihydrofolate synthase/folylpolyglutamate synthase